MTLLNFKLVSWSYSDIWYADTLCFIWILVDIITSDQKTEHFLDKCREASNTMTSQRANDAVEIREIVGLHSQKEVLAQRSQWESEDNKVFFLFADLFNWIQQRRTI